MPAGGQATIPITYRPLTMTRVATEAGAQIFPLSLARGMDTPRRMKIRRQQRARRRIPSQRSLATSSGSGLKDDMSAGSRAARKHVGRLFASTPDGSAFVWTLEGRRRP